MTLFSLVYGKVPFHDDNIVALYNKIRTQELHLPNEPDISPELKCLITQMLAKDPVNRISLRYVVESIKDLNSRLSIKIQGTN